MMKSKILIMLMALFMILFLVSGCIKKPETEQPTTEEEGTQAEEAQQEMPQEEIEERVMGEELSQLLAKAGQKVTSMYYLYYGPPEDQIGYGFYVKGEKMKVVLPARVKFDKESFYDTVYLNTQKKSAHAYCEAPGCLDKEKLFVVRYENYIRDTPFDKLNLVVYGEIKGDETIENRKVKVVEFEGRNVSGKMWIDTYSGLPLKVEETVKGETIRTEYRSLSVNSVMDSDVTR